MYWKIMTNYQLSSLAFGDTIVDKLYFMRNNYNKLVLICNEMVLTRENMLNKIPAIYLTTKFIDISIHYVKLHIIFVNVSISK